MVSFVCLNNLRLGRHLFAVGGNEKAARASGIDVDAEIALRKGERALLARRGGEGGDGGEGDES